MPPIAIRSCATNTAAAPTEFLAFTLAAEPYGIDIEAVQELRRYDAVTAIANAPAYLKGVVNLRGSIVPIFDMRIKFGVAEPVYDQFTVVIIVNVGDRITGLVVDSVSDVITQDAGQVKPPPLGAALDATFLIGLAVLGERVLLLLDLAAVTGAAEFDARCALAA